MPQTRYHLSFINEIHGKEKNSGFNGVEALSETIWLYFIFIIMLDTICIFIMTYINRFHYSRQTKPRSLIFIFYFLTSSFYSWLSWFLVRFVFLFVIYFFLYILLLLYRYAIYIFLKSISSVSPYCTGELCQYCEWNSACKSMLELAEFKLHQVMMQKCHDKRVCFILSFDEHSTK